jgi:hypothetical protein
VGAASSASAVMTRPSRTQRPPDFRALGDAEGENPQGVAAEGGSGLGEGTERPYRAAAGAARGGPILPCGHPGRASHGGDVVEIERPTPRVAGARLKGRWVFSLGGAHEARAGAPARLGVRASAAPAVPSPSRTPRACGGGSVQKVEEGTTGLADARTPPGSESEEKGKLLG